DYVVEPHTRPNPAAREDLYRVLSDEEQQEYWQSVVYAFRFLGQAEDVPRIVRWIEDFGGKPLPAERTDDLQQALTALGVMARRGVAGAGSALDKTMFPSYWRDLKLEIPARPLADRIGGSANYF